MKKEDFDKTFDNIDPEFVSELCDDNKDVNTNNNANSSGPSGMSRVTRPLKIAASVAAVAVFVVAGVILFRTPNAIPHENSAPEHSDVYVPGQSQTGDPASREESNTESEDTSGAETDRSEEFVCSRIEEGGDAGTEVSHPEESAEQNESAYINVVKGISYLSAEVFSSSRIVSGVDEDGEEFKEFKVSEQFKNHYLSFAVSLLQKCAEGKSAFISPLSALTALQMAANGASGETAAEMQKTLGGSLSTEELNQELFIFYESLLSNKTASLKSANALWMTDSEHFKVSKRFVDIINDTFRATLACAPLAEDGTVDVINDWCRKNTDGMIPKLLDYGDIDPTAVMVLLNSITFDGLWSRQYDEYECKSMTFHGETHDTAVKMMIAEEYEYISGEHETGFIKSYMDSPCRFAAILPEEGISMEEYLASLDGEKLASLLDHSHESVTTGLPEFSFDWSGLLNDALQEMGIKQAFLSTADFSGLGVMDDGTNISIGRVLQKTHIEINQSGTRAAAVTETDFAGGDDEKPEKTVILDRPFIYVIFDGQSKLPVFIGCVTDIE